MEPGNFRSASLPVFIMTQHPPGTSKAGTVAPPVPRSPRSVFAWAASFVCLHLSHCYFFFNFIVDYMNFLGYHKPVQEVFHDPFALWLDIILPFLEGPSFLCWFLCMFWFFKLFFFNILHLNVTCVLGQEVNI